GLRSYDLRNPFPEELNRKLASALARTHYAPGSWAAANVRGDVVDTGSNTIRDSLVLVPPGDPIVPLPAQPYGIVSLHRFELLNSRRLLTATMDALADNAARTPLLFVGHRVTVAALLRLTQKPGSEASGSAESAACARLAVARGSETLIDAEPCGLRKTSERPRGTCTATDTGVVPTTGMAMSRFPSPMWSVVEPP